MDSLWKIWNSEEKLEMVRIINLVMSNSLFDNIAGFFLVGPIYRTTLKSIFLGNSDQAILDTWWSLINVIFRFKHLTRSFKLILFCCSNVCQIYRKFRWTYVLTLRYLYFLIFLKVDQINKLGLALSDLSWCIKSRNY